MQLRARLVVLGLVGLVSLLVALPAAAEDITIVWQANLTVPVFDKAVLGTLTTTADPASGQGTWSFQGTIDGQLARAAGTGTMRVNGSTLTVTMTTIDTWQMPGLRQPVLPATATIQVAGNLAYVSYVRTVVNVVGLPIAVSPPLTLPLQSRTYTLMMPGSGSQAVRTLPNTGGEPQSAPGEPILLAGLGALGTLGGVILLRSRDHWRQRCRASKQ